MATTKDVKIVINPPNFQQVKLKVTGLTPLIQNKMKETQESIKKIEIEGIAGGGSIKVCLNGDGELIKLHIAPEMMKESKEIFNACLDDLVKRGLVKV